MEKVTVKRSCNCALILTIYTPIFTQMTHEGSRLTSLRNYTQKKSIVPRDTKKHRNIRQQNEWIIDYCIDKDTGSLKYCQCCICEILGVSKSRIRRLKRSIDVNK